MQKMSEIQVVIYGINIARLTGRYIERWIAIFYYFTPYPAGWIGGILHWALANFICKIPNCSSIINGIIIAKDHFVVWVR